MPWSRSWTSHKPHLNPLLKGEEEFSPFPFQGKVGDEVVLQYTHDSNKT